MGNETHSELLRALEAIDRGDFTVQIDESGSGEDGEIAAVVNKIAHRLNALSRELIRVSQEIGTYGMFGGQSEVDGLEGSWRDLESNFNLMAADLTLQIRELASVSHDIVEGKPARQLHVTSQGETRALQENLNLLFGQSPVDSMAGT